MAEGSVNRTLRVLVALCEHGPQTLAELSARTDLTPPTALRFLRIMRDEGFATQGADRTWRPTLLTWRLGCAVVDGDGWGAAVNDALKVASDAIGETIVYAAYDDGWTVYVAMAEPRLDLRTHVPLGRRYHAADTITGRCMLAFRPDDEVERVMAEQRGAAWRGKQRAAFREELAAIHTSGYASGEGGRLWQGLWGAAVPVFGRHGDVVGAVGTAITSGRRPTDPGPVVAALQRAAAALSAR